MGSRPHDPLQALPLVPMEEWPRRNLKTKEATPIDESVNANDSLDSCRYYT